METIYRSLDNPDFDTNQFKANNDNINSNVSDVLTYSSNLNNDMSNILTNANKELNKYKNILGVKDDNLSTSLNHIQWNYYYYKRYKKLNEILRHYIIVCVILIILSKLQSPYFDNLSYSFITGLIIAFLFIYVMYSLWDLFIRDNINFDEYDFTIYGTGISSNYNPNDTVDFTYTTPKKMSYDYSGCLFYSRRNTSQSQPSESYTSPSQPSESYTSPSQPSESYTSPSQPSESYTSQSQQS